MAHALSAWVSRPPEVANLLNPAFTSLLIRSAVRSYSKKDNPGLPLSLAYLILPIVLHRTTRESLPATTRTRLHTWLQANQSIAIGFADRAQRMVPYTREALLFGAQHGIIALNARACLQALPVQLKPAAFSKESEPNACMQKAELVGRLFARAGDQITILAMWGVRP